MPEENTLTSEDISRLFNNEEFDDGDTDDTDADDDKDDTNTETQDGGKENNAETAPEEVINKARAYDELSRHLEADPVWTVRTFIQKLGLSQEELFGEASVAGTTSSKTGNNYDLEDMTDNERKLLGEIHALKESLKQVASIVDTVQEIKGAVGYSMESRQARVRIKTELGVDVPEAEIDRLKEKHGVSDGVKAYKLETWGVSTKRQPAGPPNSPALKDKIVKLEHLNKFDIAPEGVKKLIEEGATIELPETLAAKYGSRFVKKK